MLFSPMFSRWPPAVASDNFQASPTLCKRWGGEIGKMDLGGSWMGLMAEPCWSPIYMWSVPEIQVISLFFVGEVGVASGYDIHSLRSAKIHHAIHGKIHYFDWAIFDSYVKLPEGTPNSWMVYN